VRPAGFRTGGVRESLIMPRWWPSPRPRARGILAADFVHVDTVLRRAPRNQLATDRRPPGGNLLSGYDQLDL